MVKRLLKIVSVLILLALVVAGVFFYSIYISVDRVNLSYQNLTSTKIPTEMNDIKIAYISDIKYNSFMNKERLTSMISELNDTGSDVVIFGGDMFDTPDKKAPDSTITAEITEILKSIDAPLGKFAVLGDQDLVNEETKTLVSSILYNSDFEIITNTIVRLRNQSNSSISLIGLDSLVNGTPDVASAFSKINNDEYNLLITHCPDLLKNNDINTQYIDTAITGHSLGGQIYLPLFGPLHTVTGAEKYNHGTYDINKMTLFVSNGLGTTETDMRLFAPPQILIFKLHHGTNKA
ncbi:metallophosphoesterase [Amedibacillus sp. YH-ame10]